MRRRARFGGLFVVMAAPVASVDRLSACGIVALRPACVRHTIGIRVPNAMLADTLHAYLCAPVLRPLLHVVIRRPVDAAVLEVAVSCRGMYVDKIGTANEGVSTWLHVLRRLVSGRGRSEKANPHNRIMDFPASRAEPEGKGLYVD